MKYGYLLGEKIGYTLSIGSILHNSFPAYRCLQCTKDIKISTRPAKLRYGKTREMYTRFPNLLHTKPIISATGKLEFWRHGFYVHFCKIM